MIKLSTEELQYITLFEKETGAIVKDCIINNNEIIVVVKEGDMGLAIGRRGEIINKFREKIGKKISVIEYSNDVSKFVKNLFAPVVLDDVKVEDDVIVISLNGKDNRRIMGKKGRRIRRAKDILNRHFGIREINVN